MLCKQRHRCQLKQEKRKFQRTQKYMNFLSLTYILKTSDNTLNTPQDFFAVYTELHKKSLANPKIQNYGQWCRQCPKQKERKSFQTFSLIPLLKTRIACVYATVFQSDVYTEVHQRKNSKQIPARRFFNFQKCSSQRLINSSIFSGGHPGVSIPK